MRLIFLLFLFFPFMLQASGISYGVIFEGVEDKEVVQSLREVSELILLRNKHPSSLSALRFRADSDTPLLLKVLHNFGYFEARLSMEIEEKNHQYHVRVIIFPGPLYNIEEFQIELFPKQNFSPDAQMLGICLGNPARADQILDAQTNLLQLLANCGYPLSKIAEEEMIADGKTKKLRILLKVDTGPLVHFGNTSIQGINSVHEDYIRKKIVWKEGGLFNASCVERTREILMETGLFASVYILKSDSLDDCGNMTMHIEVTETKHKSISVGASYQTTFGPGATFSWENRNVGGVGRILSFQADVGQNDHSGSGTFILPEFFREDQQLTLQLLAAHETIKAYHDEEYSFQGRFSKEFNPYLYFYFSIRAERLLVSDSVQNGRFWLLELPLFLKWSTVCDVLNPTSGMTFEYRATPSLNFSEGTKAYFSEVFSFCSYLPLIREEFLILAQKITLGTILSHTLGDIPVPKRFLGGSEDNLRGYRYLTVSPFKGHRPKGGRSALYYTIEPRLRVSKSFGFVPFFDIGHVYESMIPRLNGKWLKSAGLGFRYFSFFGPLRLDLAFPLNPRKRVKDPHWWVFVSLGQMF